MQGTIWKRTWKVNGVKRQAWVLDYRLGGRRKRRQFPTKEEANLAFTKLIQEQRARAYGTVIEGITLKEFYKLYDQRKEWRTETWRERVRWAMQALAPLEEMKLADLSPEILEEYKRTRLKTVATATVRAEFVALSGMLQFAAKAHYLHENPLRRTDWPQVDGHQDDPARYVPPEDLAKLLDAAGRDKPFYQFAVATGLRESELIALRWPDMKDGCVQVLGKGRKKRLVPLLPEALSALQEVPRQLDKNSRVFWWVPSRYAAYGAFQKACERAEVGPYRFHDLRHTYASYAAMAGVDLHVIGETMGHSHVTVTKRYAHLSPAYRRQEIQKMAGFLGRGKALGAREAQRRYNVASGKRK